MVRAVFIALVLCGCVTGERIDDVQIGMSRAEVIDILGDPTGVRRLEDDEALHYDNRYMSFFSPDKADYYVILRSGAVVEYGVGEVRSRGPNTLFLIPLPGN